MYCINLKTVYFIRHAKSSWKEPYLSDYQRPLNQRGLRDAPVMAEKFYDSGARPQLWICSSSQRTRQTCQFFKYQFEKAINPMLPVITHSDQLYHGSIEDYFSVISKVGDQNTSLVLFGHNFTITDLANLYSNQPIENVPTCGIVTLDFKMEYWSDIKNTPGSVRDFIYPKLYK